MTYLTSWANTKSTSRPFRYGLYLDDVLIFSETLDEHQEHPESVISCGRARLSWSSVSANLFGKKWKVKWNKKWKLIDVVKQFPTSKDMFMTWDNSWAWHHTIAKSFSSVRNSQGPYTYWQASMYHSNGHLLVRGLLRHWRRGWQRHQCWPT